MGEILRSHAHAHGTVGRQYNPTSEASLHQAGQEIVFPVGEKFSN